MRPQSSAIMKTKWKPYNKKKNAFQFIITCNETICLVTSGNIFIYTLISCDWRVPVDVNDTSSVWLFLVHVNRLVIMLMLSHRHALRTITLKCSFVCQHIYKNPLLHQNDNYIFRKASCYHLSGVRQRAYFN